MTDDVIELLERQCDFLLRQASAPDFLVQVPPFLLALAGEPRLEVHLRDLVAEVEVYIDELRAVSQPLIAELVALREEFAAKHPDLDDSTMVRPELMSSEHWAWFVSFACFDELLGGEAPLFNVDGSGGVVDDLVRVLAAKAEALIRETESQAQQGQQAATHEEPVADDWSRQFGNVRGRYNAAKRTAELRSRTAAGVSLLRLQGIESNINPPFVESVSGESMGVELNRAFRRVQSGGYLLEKAVAGHLEPSETSHVDEMVDHLRPDVDRLREELRRRVGRTRSRVALVDRFKQRCVWHDRERLLNIAADETLPGGPEDRLTAEFALYLFDQGLSPLSKPITGGLQPDLLDASLAPSFYVEAKQYTTGSNARRDVLGAVKQVFDTVGRLQGTPYAVTEAFCIVFRRSGPYYVMPDSLQADGYRLFLRLIDLAPNDQAGRRQGHAPVVLTAHHFLDIDETT